jgi:copper chaperone
MTDDGKSARRDFRIEGMSCQHCVMAVRRALERIDGVRVESVEVGRAEVAYDPAKVDDARLRGAIEAEGFTVGA